MAGINVKEAAERLKRSRTRIKQLIAAGRIAATKDRYGYPQIDAAELRRFSRIKRRNGRPAKNLAKSR